LAGVANPLVIDRSNLVLNAGQYQLIPIGLAALSYAAGSDGSDTREAQAQTATFRIAALPDPALGTILLADGLTPIQLNADLSQDALRGLVFRPNINVKNLEAAGRLGQLQIIVSDDGSALEGERLSSRFSVPIVVDVNKASGRMERRITGITSDEQAIRAVMSLDPTNPNSGFNSSSSNGATVQAEGLSSTLYSQLDKENPLYLASIGGEALIDGAPVNYAPAAVPFLFNIPIPSQEIGRAITHTFTYQSSLTGQFRRNHPATNFTLLSGPEGFSLSSAGFWSFDPVNPATEQVFGAYTNLPTKDTTSNAAAPRHAGSEFSIRYLDSSQSEVQTLSLELFSIALADGSTTLMATPSGTNANKTTFSRGEWIQSSPEGRAGDRYFKFISEATLRSYGAIPTDTFNAKGDRIFTWPSDANQILTANRKPLTQLDGTTVINVPGYYDFTRRNGQGNGVEFLYATTTDKGKPMDYIVGVRFFLSNNLFGDNDTAANNIGDPGALVTLLPELGTITTSLTGYEIIKTGNSNNELLLNTQQRQFNLAGPLSFSSGSSRMLLAAAAGGNYMGMQPEAGTQHGERSTEGVAKQSAGLGVAKERDNTTIPQAKGPTERGLKLDPLRELATPTIAEPAPLLEQLSDTNILGTNLLDALALGAGVLYLLYGPKAIESSKGGLRSWLAGGFSRRQPAAQAAAPDERSVLALFVMRQANGPAQLVAARMGSGSLELLAQEDLPAQASGAQLNAPLQTLLERLPQQRYNLLLLDPRLQQAGASAQLEQLSEGRQSLATDQLAGPLAACSSNDLAQLRAWLNKPSGSLPQDLPLFQLLQQRQQSYATALPEQQATMASLIELSLALAWSERG